jgi:PqqD family protein of HPr-rel-A system
MSLYAPLWRCVPVDALVWREWEGELAVRNERTGSTHLLGPLAGSVLQLLMLAEPGLSVAELAARLRDNLPPGSLQSEAAIDEVLAEFRRLGLAESDRR